MTEGENIVKASLVGTAGFALSAGLAAAWPAAALAALVVAGVLFVGGVVTFAGALVRAAARSRTEQLHLSGVFFLHGAPSRVRRLLLGSLAFEVIVAFATAAVRPNSSLAFGILALLWGQGLAGLWGARHGIFPARPAPPPRTPRPSRRPTAAPPTAAASLAPSPASPPTPPSGEAPAAPPPTADGNESGPGPAGW